MTTTEMLMATADKAEWLAGRRLALDGMVREVRRAATWRNICWIRRSTR